MKKNEASKYFPKQKLIDKIFDDLEKQKCSNCKFKKEVFSYNLTRTFISRNCHN